jgi:hypothetical protein
MYGDCLEGRDRGGHGSAEGVPDKRASAPVVATVLAVVSEIYMWSYMNIVL